MNQDSALALLGHLQALGYGFTTVSPATHARVFARPLSGPPTVRDIFGWSRPFREEEIEPELLRLLKRADALLSDGEGRMRSAYRVSSLGSDLFLHSAFPTDRPDSVFFGPDTYRFVRFIRDSLPRLEGIGHVIDMGCGSGAGGIAAARLLKGAALTLVDVNPVALEVAEVNALRAGMKPTLALSDGVPGEGDLLLANPPYMIDRAGRAYRDGGDLFGGEVALKWVEQALAKLRPGGTMLLYTGAAVVDGRMPLVAEVEARCGHGGAALRTDEIDPDVFGEELEEAGYERVERIAAVGITIRLAG